MQTPGQMARRRRAKGPIKVSALMTTEMPVLTVSDSLQTAVEAMQRYGQRYALVVDQGKFEGIVTDRDIRLILPSRLASAVRQQAALATLRVHEVCIHSPYVVNPNDSAESAVALMSREQIGALPVVDGELPVGLISLHQVARSWLELERERVGSGMQQGATRKTAVWRRASSAAMTTLVAGALLLVGCASTQSLSAQQTNEKLRSSAAQQACLGATADRTTPKPWEAESRPFDADRIDLAAVHQRALCARADAESGGQGAVDAASSGVDASLRRAVSPEPLAPRYCGLTPVMPGGPEC